MRKSPDLTPEDMVKIRKWLDAHWPQTRHQCPVCVNSQWVIADHLVHLGAPGTTTYYPNVMVLCRTCSYVRLFNAMPMGIVERTKDGASG